MYRPLFLLSLFIVLSGCGQIPEVSSISPNNWSARAIEIPRADSLSKGTSYLSVYSQIYSKDEHRIHDLTATVSMRNTSLQDSIYIERAVYYNTQGEVVRTYFNHPIFIRPMETVEIVIDELDKEGGTGANFLFYWQAPPAANTPIFEAIMISTAGQQGLSFTTQSQMLD